jgi:hypothetical protein
MLRSMKVGLTNRSDNTPIKSTLKSPSLSLSLSLSLSTYQPTYYRWLPRIDQVQDDDNLHDS